VKISGADEITDRELVEMSRNRKLLSADIQDEPDWESVLNEYLNFLSGCGRSRNTILIYKDQVSRFYREKEPKWDLEKESFFEWNGEPQIHSNHRLDACKRFWAWAVGAGRRKTNPAEGVLRRMTNKNPVANGELASRRALAAMSATTNSINGRSEPNRYLPSSSREVSAASRSRNRAFSMFWPARAASFSARTASFSARAASFSATTPCHFSRSRPSPILSAWNRACASS
jgi:hypothetical protein